jgi:hypothetical protein
MKNLIGARFQLERRLTAAESGRVLGESRQCIEHLAASAAAYLAARGPQHLRGQAKYRLALITLREH